MRLSGSVDATEQLKTLDGLPDVVMRFDAEARIRFGNRRAARLFGLRPAEIVGRRCAELGLPPELERAVTESLAKVLGNGMAVTAELRVPRGRRDREFEATFIPASASGRVESVVVIAREVTKPRRLERRYQALFEAMFDGFLVVEVLRRPDGGLRDVRCLAANPTLLRMVGHEAARFVGRTSRQVMPALDPWWLEQFEEVERTGTARTVGRQVLPGARDLEALVYRAGPGRCAAVVRDVTERKRAEAALRESEARLRFMTDNMVDMISVLSPDGRFEYLSPSYRLGLGIEPASLVGVWAGVLIDPEEGPSVVTRVQNAIDSGQESVRLTYRHRHAAGDHRWLDSIVRLVYDAGTLSKIVVTSRDITAQHETEEETRRLSARLRELSARLETAAEDAARDISRRVHDDLGQALTALKTYAVWLRARLDDAQPALRERAREMLQLIDETLQSVRSISRELRPLILEDLGLAAALQWQGAEFARRTGLRCSVECSPEEPEVPAALALRLFQVAQQALTNVERHAHASAVRIDLASSAGTLTMAVTDDGCGFQVPARRSERSLGLLLMEERAAAIGGRLSVRPEPRGTRVEVTVPLATAGIPDGRSRGAS